MGAEGANDENGDRAGPRAEYLLAFCYHYRMMSLVLALPSNYYYIRIIY